MTVPVNVNLETGACTNRIEVTWNAMKSTICASGRHKSFYLVYLAKYQKNCRINKLDPFMEFLSALLYSGVCKGASALLSTTLY